MILLLLERHLIRSVPNGNGGTTFYYYYDAYTWAAAAIVLAWLIWMLVRRYRSRRALRRPPRPTNIRVPKRIRRAKRALSSHLLQPGLFKTIHAVGIGKIGAGAFCIQLFTTDPNSQRSPNSGANLLPTSFLGVPLILIEMPEATFLEGSSREKPTEFPHGIRDRQELIVGGISAANTNLTGQSGTIAYFCTRKRRLPGRKEIHLLSNSHVFADLRKAAVDSTDMILQPSPGEPMSNRPIASLVDFSSLKFDNGSGDANHVDAAIAKLWEPQTHRPLIPLIGSVKGYVLKRDIEVGETARKFGRTTGYTEGRIFSLHLDIRIRYDRTGKSAFFSDQLLIAPTLPKYKKFVSKGDSGSLVLDGEQRALGLIFAGMADLPGTSGDLEQADQPKDAKPEVPRVENYGIANPISEVLDRLRIDLVI